MNHEIEAQGMGARSRAAVVADPTVAADRSPEDLVEALRRVGVFADLPDEQLDWFAGRAEELRLAPGEVLFRAGEPADRMAVYLEGEVHARRDEHNLSGYVFIARAGDPATEVTGKLPFSRMTEFVATGRAVSPTRALIFPARLFPELLQRMPLLAERLVWIMSDRVREFTRVNEQQDRLMALGKLSAGLAHELNNPAAAARRAAQELLGALEELRASDLMLCRHELGPGERGFIAEFEHELIARAESAAGPPDSLAQSDREDTLGAWLDAAGVSDGWRIAPALADAGADESG
ncbi:MAG: Crp/Fnr family transcriptional regulator, partial [Pyrinomonadaceae bacterium]